MMSRGGGGGGHGAGREKQTLREKFGLYCSPCLGACRAPGSKVAVGAQSIPLGVGQSKEPKSFSKWEHGDLGVKGFLV